MKKSVRLGIAGMFACLMALPASAEPEAAPAPAPAPPTEAEPSRGPSNLAVDSPLAMDELLATVLERVRKVFRERVEALDAKGEVRLADQARREQIQAEIRFAAARLMVRAGRPEQAAAELQSFVQDLSQEGRSGEGTGRAPPSTIQAGTPPGRKPAPELTDLRAPYNVAVEGPGFFRVASPSGEEAYVKEAVLGLADDGRVILAGFWKASGKVQILPLLPPIVIKESVQRLVVNKDGAIQVKTVEGDTRFVGQIDLAVFPHGEDDLVPGGDDSGLMLLFPAPGAPAPEYYLPGPGSPAGVIMYWVE